MSNFMEAAVREACDGVMKDDGGPFGAVIVRGGKIIARGHNMVIIDNDPTAHAEVTAIRNACKILKCINLSDCELYTSCYPCPMCMGAVLWSRLKAVYYAATPEEAAKAGFDDKKFYDFLKNLKTSDDGQWKLEALQISGYMKPFHIWNEKEDRKLY